MYAHAYDPHVNIKGNSTYTYQHAYIYTCTCTYTYTYTYTYIQGGSGVQQNLSHVSGNGADTPPIIYPTLKEEYAL